MQKAIRYSIHLHPGASQQEVIDLIQDMPLGEVWGEPTVYQKDDSLVYRLVVTGVDETQRRKVNDYFQHSGIVKAFWASYTIILAENWEQAFAYCREANKPVAVQVATEDSPHRIFPSGRYHLLDDRYGR